MKTTFAIGLILGSTLLGTAAPSFAAEDQGTLSPAPVREPSPPDDGAMAKLQKLVGTQTEAEIQAIMSAGPSIALFDPETGGASAAYATEVPSPISRLITMRGPGCGGDCTT